ncbi:hypothetical protein BSPWISOXPB_6342 [uncultured Gammaproteobacteria bacterium]|nr:hypothetical protein BSPWISOXPB_6342 [uncultured Gammaproteobacteria bacterium]
MPIVASDPVIYTVTATGRRGHDTATVVILLLVSVTTNLALGKPATESSTYPYSIPVAASYAVDGNTNGEFLNSSTTHTNIEQGAWCRLI